MKFVPQSIEFKWSTPNPLFAIADGARVAYLSTPKQSDEEFIRNVLLNPNPQHKSPLEQADATYHVVTNRAIANEIVRHRMASFVQESTRWVNYNKGKFGNELTFIEPWKTMDDVSKRWYTDMCFQAEQTYKAMTSHGVTPQFARDILPLCTKTELRMKLNFSSWRNFFQLRSAPNAHPQIVELANMIMDDFEQRGWGVIVEDIRSKKG